MMIGTSLRISDIWSNGRVKETGKTMGIYHMYVICILYIYIEREVLKIASFVIPQIV